MSNMDEENIDEFCAQLCTKAQYIWHLHGRIGPYPGSKTKLRIDVQGNHEDIEALKAWCRTPHHNVYATYIEPATLYTMRFSGRFRELEGSW